MVYWVHSVRLSVRPWARFVVLTVLGVNIFFAYLPRWALAWDDVSRVLRVLSSICIFKIIRPWPCNKTSKIWHTCIFSRPLQSSHISDWILSIIATNDHYHEMVCSYNEFWTWPITWRSLSQDFPEQMRQYYTTSVSFCRKNIKGKESLTVSACIWTWPLTHQWPYIEFAGSNFGLIRLIFTRHEES